METLLRYFPDLTAAQRERFAVLDEAYRTWNERINVISRKDIDRLYPHHVLHSLAIAKVCALRPGARVMDVGCGGGFPGIPLAILFPEARFTLVDSIGKKIRVVDEVIRATGLNNVRTVHGRAEQVGGPLRFRRQPGRHRNEDVHRLGMGQDRPRRGGRARCPTASCT